MKTNILLLALTIILVSQSALAEFTTIIGRCKFSEPPNLNLSLQIRDTYLSQVGLPSDDPRQHVYSLALMSPDNKAKNILVAERLVAGTNINIISRSMSLSVDSQNQTAAQHYVGVYADDHGFSDSAMNCDLTEDFFTR